jgi:hypothetical protein
MGTFVFLFVGKNLLRRLERQEEEIRCSRGVKARFTALSAVCSVKMSLRKRLERSAPCDCKRRDQCYLTDWLRLQLRCQRALL